MRVVLTKEAASAIRAASVFQFKDTAQPLSPETVEVEMSEESHARLLEASLPGESISDCIVRVVSLTVGGGRQ